MRMSSGVAPIPPAESPPMLPSMEGILKLEDGSSRGRQQFSQRRGGNVRASSVKPVYHIRRSGGDTNTGGGRGGRQGYYQRRSWGVSGAYGAELVAMERADLRRRLVKVGDNLEFVVKHVFDMSTHVEEYLANEMYTWQVPEIEQEFLSSGSGMVFKTPHRLGTETEYVVETILECVCELPTKHSHYAALLGCCLASASGCLTPRTGLHQLLKRASAVTADTATLVKTSAEDNASDGGGRIQAGMMTQDVVLVKTEDEIHQTGVSIEGSTAPPPGGSEDIEVLEEPSSSKGGLLPSKTEERVSLSREETEYLFMVHLVESLIERVYARIANSFGQTFGLHKTKEMQNLLMFVIDLANLRIIDPRSVIEGLVGLLRAYVYDCVNFGSVVDSTLTSESRDVFAKLGMSIWLAKFVCSPLLHLTPGVLKETQNFDFAELVIELLGKIRSQLINLMTNTETGRLCGDLNNLIFVDDSGNFAVSTNSGHGGTDQTYNPDDLISTELGCLLSAFRRMRDTQFICKSIVRIYTSAKICELVTSKWQQQMEPSAAAAVVAPPMSPSGTYNLASLFPSLLLKQSFPVSPSAIPSLLINWQSFIAIPPPTSNVDKALDSDLYHLVKEPTGPPSCKVIFWREDPKRRHRLRLFTPDDIRQSLSVEPLGPTDLWIIEELVESVVASYFSDATLCSEALLRLPIQHDQFIHVLISAIFNVFLMSSIPPLKSECSVGLGPMFLAELLHRIVLLQRSSLPVLMQAIQNLLKAVSHWHDSVMQFMVTLIAQLATHDPRLSQGVLEELAKLPDVRDYVVTRDVKLKGDTTVQEETAAPSDTQTAIALIDPFSSGDLLRSSALRLTFRIIAKLHILLWSQSCPKFIPPALYPFTPDEVPLESIAGAWLTAQFTDIRTPGDLLEIASGLTHNQPPLEFLVVQRALKLSPRRPDSVKLTIDAIFNFLISRLDKPYLASLKNITDDVLMKWFDPEQYERQFQAKPDLEVTTKKEENVGSGSSSSSSIPSSGGLETKNGDAEDPVMVTDDPIAMMVKGEIEEENQRPEESRGQNQQRVIVSSRDFEQFDFDYMSSSTVVWTIERLARFVYNCLVVTGARTMSHSQRVLDLYAPLIWRLRVFALHIKEEETPQSSDPQLFDTFKFGDKAEFGIVGVFAVFDCWFRVSLGRCQYVLYQFIQSRVINTFELVKGALLWKNQQGVSILLAVGGDCFLFDLFVHSLCAERRLCKQAEIRKNDFMRLNPGIMRNHEDLDIVNPVAVDDTQLGSAITRFHGEDEARLLTIEDWDTYLKKLRERYENAIGGVLNLFLDLYEKSANENDVMGENQCCDPNNVLGLSIKRLYHAGSLLREIGPEVNRLIKDKIQEFENDRKKIRAVNLLKRLLVLLV